MHPVPGLMPHAASSNDYEPGFMTDLMCKDLGLAVDAARNLRVPLFVAPAAQQVYRLASSHGLGAQGLHQRLHLPQAVLGHGPRLERMDWPRRWLARLGKLGIVLVVVAVVLITSFFASLPEIVRQVVVRQVPKAIGRQISIEDIDLNLFTG